MALRKFLAILVSTSIMFVSNVLADVSSTLHLLPKHLQAVNPSAIYFAQGQQILLSESSDKSKVMALPHPFSGVQIDIKNATKHIGDFQSINQSFRDNNQHYQVFYTQGTTTGIGEIFGGGKHWYFEVRSDGVWTVDMTNSQLLPGLYDNDVVNIDHVHKNFSAPAFTTHSQSTGQYVDILLLYTPNIQAVYPGEMTQTLLNHLVARANQSFADSDIMFQLRLVGTEFINYLEPSNFTALNDLSASLTSQQTATNGPLSSVRQRRDQTGADLVAMIRTHDLNEREVCGVARFPDSSTDVLINISNVGISGGSNCMDTFTHEVGHNFGAGHQRRNGTSQGIFEDSGAFVELGKFNTQMSAFGTGNLDRDLGLPVFSNPQIMCGGRPCGDATVANNARTMNELIAQNAGLRAEVNPGTPVFPAKSVRDTDSDGVPDSEDAFPFLATEIADSDGDGVGDVSDAFPNNSSETLDTDGDGIGNNADSDDDGDGVNDIQDDLPLDARDSVDNDGDSFGQSRDQLDDDFQEIFDADNDAIGDSADPDDDNDGVPDFYPDPTLEQSQAMVISAANDSILVYDSAGDFVSRPLQVAPGGFSFRSDLVVGPGNRAYFISFSDVMQLDMNPTVIRETISRDELQTNFPAHLTLLRNSLSVVHGLGTSYIDSFSLGSTRNIFLSNSLSTAVFRDIAFAQGNTGYIVVRDENRIATFQFNSSNDEFPTFASQGMNKPEHIAVDNSGRVFVTNAGNNTVTYYNSQGGFLGTFVEAGSGGLGAPSCLEFGPDDHLYVCSGDTNQVLRFDGQSGAFLSVFIDNQGGELQQPVSLKFISLPFDSERFSGDHDTDGDGVNNDEDDLPLDASETVDTDSDGIGNNADTDDDNDGMPDDFETQFGFDPLNAADANDDPDGDGFTNIQEFTNGTDPTVADEPDPAPTPTPTPAPDTGSGGGGVLSWYAGLLLMLVACRRCRRHI